MNDTVSKNVLGGTTFDEVIPSQVFKGEGEKERRRGEEGENINITCNSTLLMFTTLDIHVPGFSFCFTYFR